MITFTDLSGNEAKVEYTFGYKLIDGKLKIDLHHSSFPFKKLGADVDYGNYFTSYMSNRLFRIKINEEFKGDNLFYSSLANNSSFDSKTIRDY